MFVLNACLGEPNYFRNLFYKLLKRFAFFEFFCKIYWGVHMIIGFGIGSPLTAILMLIITSLLSFYIFKAFKKREGHNFDFDELEYRKKRREFYYYQRQKAREMAKKYDLTDEEIEQIINDEINDRW